MGQLIDDIANYLQAKGIGTIATNIFEGMLPDSPDVAICLYDTAGLQPDIYIPLNMPSFQIVHRNTELDLGEQTCDMLRSLLDRQYNILFVTNGVYVYSCNLTAQGGHIGRDDRGRDMFSLNFQCKVR